MPNAKVNRLLYNKILYRFFIRLCFYNVNLIPKLKRFMVG